mmetsp:Transcript_16762/g.48257  ORF Transcript_16762/g.48257 Transcript_16762/m.48257 type:complete len:347 (+) Transcript_16762:836-1876(+)
MRTTLRSRRSSSPSPSLGESRSRLLPPPPRRATRSPSMSTACPTVGVGTRLISSVRPEELAEGRAPAWPSPPASRASGRVRPSWVPRRGRDTPCWSTPRGWRMRQEATTWASVVLITPQKRCGLGGSASSWELGVRKGGRRGHLFQSRWCRSRVERTSQSSSPPRVTYTQQASPSSANWATARRENISSLPTRWASLTRPSSSAAPSLCRASSTPKAAFPPGVRKERRKRWSPWRTRPTLPSGVSRAVGITLLQSRRGRRPASHPAFSRGVAGGTAASATAFRPTSTPPASWQPSAAPSLRPTALFGLPRGRNAPWPLQPTDTCTTGGNTGASGRRPCARPSWTSS